MWATGAALATTLLMTVVLLLVVVKNSMPVFWPSRVALLKMSDGREVLGEWLLTEENPDTEVVRAKLKTGNRELDAQRQDFHWFRTDAIEAKSFPEDALVLERLEHGNFYGYLEQLRLPGAEEEAEKADAAALEAAIASVKSKHEKLLGPVEDALYDMNNDLRNLRYRMLRLDYEKRHAGEQADTSALEAELAELEEQGEQIKQESDQLVAEQHKLESGLRKNVALMTTAGGRSKEVALVDIVRVYAPNRMGIGQQLGHYAIKLWEVVWENPRESNQEGGLFPCIFGTVLMIFLMAITCFPLGVLAGIYLGEYAKEGPLVRLVRIAVNNLAGIPSIVYGIFGLAFFVYGLGGMIDQWFVPERVEASEPLFGHGCILWASLTLGLLTVPVVIVSTEEALRSIPRGISEGSYALGSTKFQTLVRLLIPMGSPGIMTGFILAMARAAGEVAPLMITGMVKSAPVPLDARFPYLHLNSKFMHLGFHIYDVGFQSPNVEATKPMVYVTTFVLLVIVLTMSSVAIWLRNRMRRQFQVRTI